MSMLFVPKYFLTIFAALTLIAGVITQLSRVQSAYQKPLTVQQQKALPHHWANAIKEYRN